MKQPKKLRQRPDLKQRLDAARAVPKPDVSFTVTLPADVFRSLEAVAAGNVPAWVAQMLVEYVEGDLKLEDSNGDT